jgi:hypothetical protein
MEENIGLRFDLSAIEGDSIVRRHRAQGFTLPPITLREDVHPVARRGWEDRTRSEYTGVMIVRHFHGLLVDLNAPMDLQELALAMLLQEQQHAQYCMAAARSLGSEGEVAFELSELQLQRDNSPLEEQLLTMVVGTYCCGEVVAHVLLRHAIQALPDTPYRDILKRIARDEVLHARIGTLLLGSIREKSAPKWIEYPGDDWVVRTAETNLAMLRQRDVIEEDEAMLFEDPAAGSELCSVGIPPSEPFKEAYHYGVNEVVPRGLVKIGIPFGSNPT